MRKLISIVVLTVYSMVLAHNFIPHHHHSGQNPELQHCQLENAHEHSCNHTENTNHSIYIAVDCCADHHQHTFCSFYDETVLTKWINLSSLFLPSSELFYSELAQKKQSFSDTYIALPSQEPFCPDVLLRGPPQLS